ncbi:Queuosine biosynthesis protein [Tolypocladium paradoxum]|uniref:Queuosine biosynthesis protein n=1 Tax=Tolypocladium paradoxum TaxID=94208 RepID=A0A2S4KW16_9HYPO|nr:Queuosine biosynthesis protein [Tolypocladium paradoxum]
MKTKEFDFNVDSRVLPSDPVELRGRSRDSGRMIVLDRSAATIEHTVFSTICEFFRPGDLLVLNDSYTLANTLWFQHGDTSTQVDLCGHEPDGTTIVEIFERPLAKPGLILTSMDDDRLTCTLIEPQPGQLWKARFKPFELLVPVLDQYGQRVDDSVNLNPQHWKTAPQAFRSVYAKAPGSLEIPSAGLHFSNELLAQAAAKGVEVANITLHVGATEILAVRHISEEEIENHKVRSEYFEVGDEAAAQINLARAEGRRVIAVGTTVMRTLETLAAEQELKAAIQAQSGWTDLYIYPGFNFKVVDVLLTNLHQPRSSHIVLTAAFAGKDFVMRSYAEITERGGYEFDMFGDSMLIV